MKFANSFLALLLSSSACTAFTPSRVPPAFGVGAGCSSAGTTTALSLSSSPSSSSSSSGDAAEGSDAPEKKQSRLQGNIREPTAAEISVMDDMITKLSNAKAYELPNAVSQAIRVVSSPRFFMRIAERADMSTDELEKAKLSALADNLVSTIEAVVSTAEDRLEERAQDVEAVVKAAAEPDSGEFFVPLSADRIDAVRKAVRKLEPEALDEGFLSTIDAWMNKSHQDGMDGMVGILQKVLQIYAGTAISRSRAQLQANVGAAIAGEDQAKADKAVADMEEEGPTPASSLLERLLAVDTDSWDAELRSGLAAGGDVSSKALMGEVQRTIEGVVLGLENGSMAQRVQAEFLRELVTRIEAIEQSS